MKFIFRKGTKKLSISGNFTKQTKEKKRKEMKKGK